MAAAIRKVFRLLLGPEVRCSLDAVLNDRKVELVINLTNPRSHFAVSKACLEAGKRVYLGETSCDVFPSGPGVGETGRREKG